MKHRVFWMVLVTFGQLSRLSGAERVLQNRNRSLSRQPSSNSIAGGAPLLAGSRTICVSAVTGSRASCSLRFCSFSSLSGPCENTSFCQAAALEQPSWHMRARQTSWPEPSLRDSPRLDPQTPWRSRSRASPVPMALASSLRTSEVSATPFRGRRLNALQAFAMPRKSFGAVRSPGPGEQKMRTGATDLQKWHLSQSGSSMRSPKRANASSAPLGRRRSRPESR